MDFEVSGISAHSSLVNNLLARAPFRREPRILLLFAPQSCVFYENLSLKTDSLFGTQYTPCRPTTATEDRPCVD